MCFLDKKILVFCFCVGCCFICIPGNAEETACVPLADTLDLETAHRRALSDNPGLQAAALRVEQARQRLTQARALYFPSLAATYSASKTWLSDRAVNGARAQAYEQAKTPLSSILNTPNPNPFSQFAQVGNTLVMARHTRNTVDDTVDSYALGLQAQYILFNGFERKFTYAIARFARQETEAAQNEAARLLLDAVAQSFYAVQLARENVAIAKADIEFNERLLKEAKVRREVGTGSLSDELNFEVQIRSARSALLNAKRTWKVARVTLAALMGLPDSDLPEHVVLATLAEEKEEELLPPGVDEQIDYALSHRPDLQRNRYSVERARAQVGQKRAQFFPQVSLFASQDASLSDDSHFEDEDFSSTVGFNISQTLFAGGANYAAWKEARYARQEAERLLSDVELGVVSDVREAVANLTTAQEELRLQRATTDYVKRNRDLVEKEYNAGQGALVRLTQAQRDLIAAESRLAQGQVSLQQAWHNLRTSTGETLGNLENLN